MTRAGFIARLRDELRGLEPRAVDDIVADYEGHFAEGEAAGRSEADVAAALGDPTRLARELRLEAGLKRWESEKNPSAAIGAIIALIGLGAIDFVILLPLLMGVIGVIIGIYFAVIGIFIAGCVVFAAGPFLGLPGGPAAAMLGGLGLMASQVFVGAVTTIVTVGLVNALVWYARLHYRLLKPAIEPTP